MAKKKKNRRSKSPVAARMLKAGIVKRETGGACHDLREIRDVLIASYDDIFGRSLRVDITWRNSLTRYRNGPRNHEEMLTGQYHIEDNFIEIHRALDRPWVPRFYVEWIVFHELLHAKYPPKWTGRGHRFHPPEFLRREENFIRLVEAQRWERRNLTRLLRF